MTEQDVKHHEHPSNEPNNEKKNEKKIRSSSDWLTMVMNGEYVKYNEPIVDEDAVKNEEADDESDEKAVEVAPPDEKDNPFAKMKDKLQGVLLYILLIFALDYCDVYQFKGERGHIATLPVVEMNDSAFNPQAVTLEKIRPMRFQDKVKITLRNNTDTVLVSFDARIYYYGARKNYYQTFNTRSGRYMYTIIQPHETKTFKIPKVRGISDNPFYRVEFVLQGYAKYDDYSRIYL